jgi:hypothetical protein
MTALTLRCRQAHGGEEMSHSPPKWRMRTESHEVTMDDQEPE